MTVAELIKKIFSLEIGIYNAFKGKPAKKTGDSKLVEKARAEIQSSKSKTEASKLTHSVRKSISK